ncbi:MAG TPA: hypothetical protein VGR27_00800, partial [Longimicrobiaceae bacterium]|nr:hypothetical protein [Longimicrobiaceae bacterium]
WRCPMRPIPPALLLAALAAACAPAASSPGDRTVGPNAAIIESSTSVLVRINNDESGMTRTLDAAPERVWAVLPAVYGELGIPVEVSDANARVIGNRRVTTRRIGGERINTRVRCGNDGAGPSAMNGYLVQLSILTSLQPAAAEKTVLTTQIGGHATPIEGTSTSRVLCATTGRLEQRIAQLIAGRLEG